MERYDYREAVLNDVKEYIESNIDLDEWKENRDELEDRLNDELWTADGVTGNGSGSYTFSAWDAEENLCHNLDLLAEAVSEFGGDFGETLESPESADVTIRCYLLGQAIAEALDDLEANGAFDETEEEDDE